MLQATIDQIVSDPSLHAKWLNTLSYMENCGARKISKCEHPTRTNLMVLKHAAEEHRHAYYLKKMIDRVQEGACETYEVEELLAGHTSRHYLHRLDIFASKYLQKTLQLSGEELKYVAYLYVTYAIEVRADDLYPVYHEVLKKHDSPVSVWNIIKEEEGHLEEMISSLEKFDANWEVHAKVIRAYEEEVFQAWMRVVEDCVAKEGKVTASV
ncbi:MAG: hypothetical protein ACI9RU_003079 [Litorivivens sp.]|jgi:hypothetical protein